MQKKKTDTLSHIDDENNPAMVNVAHKLVTERKATARTTVQLSPLIMELLEEGEIKTKKGPVFHTAILAGTMAAKKTADLIPLCHPLNIEGCNIEIHTQEQLVIIDCTCTITSKTGVEMEALTGATVAGLTIYDMCKAISHDIVIKDTHLIKKTGGKSDFKAKKVI